jgi:hypothetical protein
MRTELSRAVNGDAINEPQRDISRWLRPVSCHADQDVP